MRGDRGGKILSPVFHILKIDGIIIGGGPAVESLGDHAVVLPEEALQDGRIAHIGRIAGPGAGVVAVGVRIAEAQDGVFFQILLQHPVSKRDHRPRSGEAQEVHVEIVDPYPVDVVGVLEAGGIQRALVQLLYIIY